MRCWLRPSGTRGWLLCVVAILALLWTQAGFLISVPDSHGRRSLYVDDWQHERVQKGPLPDPAIILFCYNRPDYLDTTLQSLASLPGLERFSIYISQDGNDTGVAEMVKRHTPNLRSVAQSFAHWQHPRIPLLGLSQPGYAWLAQHYKWGLDRVFLQHMHSHAVIVEDDMVFSQDFLVLFNETAWLLDADPTIWCISSWNDNGIKTDHTWNATRLLRTSYFPGLGWMLRAELWRELSPNWPAEHWDHWMRMESVAKGRDCVAPELNRNRNIGEVGANMDASLYRRWLAHMDWADGGRLSAPAEHPFGDLSYLLQEPYEASLRAAISSADLVTQTENSGPIVRTPVLPRDPQPGQVILVLYGIEQYSRLARKLHVWKDPRAHYHHVSMIPWRGATVLLADARWCDLLPPERRWKHTESWTVHIAAPNVSCHSACHSMGLVCNSADLHFLNTCPGLQAHVECPHGCGLEWGPDLPNIVVPEHRPNGGMCYVTQQMPNCRGSAGHTRRVCPCVPVSSLPTTIGGKEDSDANGWRSQHHRSRIGSQVLRQAWLHS